MSCKTSLCHKFCAFLFIWEYILFSLATFILMKIEFLVDRFLLLNASFHGLLAFIVSLMRSQLLIFIMVSLYVMSYFSFIAFQTLIFNSLVMMHLGMEFLIFTVCPNLGFIQLLGFLDLFFH